MNHRRESSQLKHLDIMFDFKNQTILKLLDFHLLIFPVALTSKVVQMVKLKLIFIYSLAPHLQV